VDAPRRFRIVVALDGSDYAQAVLEHALDQAARHDAPDVNVVAVVEPGQVVEFDEVARALRARIHELLATTIFTFCAGAEWRVRVHVRRGLAGEEIAALAEEIQADLVVVGRFGAGVARRGRPGSVADDVIRMTSCPTLVVQVPDYPHVDAEPRCADCVAEG
jgi:nucleotide-binding universal stress UspA family protein